MIISDKTYKNTIKSLQQNELLIQGYLNQTKIIDNIPNELLQKILSFYHIKYEILTFNKNLIYSDHFELSDDDKCATRSGKNRHAFLGIDSVYPDQVPLKHGVHFWRIKITKKNWYDWQLVGVTRWKHIKMSEENVSHRLMYGITNSSGGSGWYPNDEMSTEKSSGYKYANFVSKSHFGTSSKEKYKLTDIKLDIDKKELRLYVPGKYYEAILFNLDASEDGWMLRLCAAMRNTQYRVASISEDIYGNSTEDIFVQQT
eukprot:270477_1